MTSGLRLRATTHQQRPRQGMDRFVPRDDGLNVIASEARQFTTPSLRAKPGNSLPRHCERSPAIHYPVIASEARQSMDRFVHRKDSKRAR